MKDMASISSVLLDELITTVEVIGIERTVKTLQDAKSNSLLLNDLNIDFILTSVSDITSVPKDRILHGNDRNDERKIAVAICVYFIKNEFLYSFSDIKKILNKHESALSRYNTLVESVPSKPKTDFDKKLDSAVKKMKLLITEKKLRNG